MNNAKLCYWYFELTLYFLIWNWIELTNSYHLCLYTCKTCHLSALFQEKVVDNMKKSDILIPMMLESLHAWRWQQNKFTCKPMIKSSRNDKLFSESCRLVRYNSNVIVNGLERAAWKMRVPHGVDADGDLNRYLQECMLVHDEWVIVWPNWVVPQKQYKLLSLFRDGERTKAFFCGMGAVFSLPF